MKKYLETLQKCPLFRQVTEADLSAMLNCLGSRIIKASRSETVFLEGDPARYVGIVLSGSVQIVQEDYYGNRNIVNRIEPSGLFGETFACAGIPALPVSIIATDDSEIMLIDCRRIISSCGNACAFHNQLIHNLLQIVAMKNLFFHQKLEITSRRTTREKLMTYLLSQAKFQQNTHITIPYDRQELADYLGVDRSGLSAEISKLRREGVLFCHKNEFQLLKEL